MKLLKHLCFLFFLIFYSFLNGQSRTLKGKIISEFMEPNPGVQIQNLDTLLLGTTDFDGNFSILSNEKAEGLLISYVGLEWLTISLPENCDYLEIIVFEDGTYDFMSERKIDRIREKRFNKLPELHL